MDYNSISNGILMWILCMPACVLMVLECVLFFRKSLQQTKEMGIEKEVISTTIKTSAVTAIGPCLVVVAALLSLMTYVGTPLAWMRNTIIGSASEELMAANWAAEGMGIDLNSALASGTLNINFLVTAAFIMAAGQCGYLVVSAIFADKIPILSEKAGGKNQAMVLMITSGAIIGAISQMTCSQTFPLRHQTVSVVAAAGVMFALTTIKKKHPEKTWISKWSVGLSMFAGMFAGYFFSLAIK